MENKIQKLIIAVSCAVLLGLIGLCMRLEQQLIRPEAPNPPKHDTTVQTAAPLTDSAETEEPTQDSAASVPTTEQVPVSTVPPITNPPAPPETTHPPVTTQPPESTSPSESTPLPETTEPEQTAPDASAPQIPDLGDTELPPV